MKNPFEKLERKYEKMRRQRDEARAELLKLRAIQVTIEPSAEYEIKDFEVGKWYKNRIDSVRCRFTEKGSLNSGYVIFDWKNNISMTDLKNWQEMTPKQIELLLTERCEELGLFNGEFECLSGLICIYKKGFIDYCEEDDKLWIDGNLAYEKGKFAKLVE